MSYKCNICGTIYENIQEYADCVVKCANKAKVNEEQQVYEKFLAIENGYNKAKKLLKEKYPEKYSKHFAPVDNEKSAEDPVKRKDVRIYHDPKGTKATVNGKEVKPEELSKDPALNYVMEFMKLLGGR